MTEHLKTSEKTDIEWMTIPCSYVGNVCFYVFMSYAAMSFSVHQITPITND